MKRECHPLDSAVHADQLAGIQAGVEPSLRTHPVCRRDHPIVQLRADHCNLACKAMEGYPAAGLVLPQYSPATGRY